MTTIRSAPPPMIPPRPGADARAAFFRQMTLPQVAAPAAGPATAPSAAASSLPAAAPTQTRTPSVEQPQAPQRMLRPGSIIDIKV